MPGRLLETSVVFEESSARNQVQGRQSAKKIF